MALEWRGQPIGHILVLLPEGRRLAQSLGVQPIKGQYERGMALHKSVEHLYLILEVVDILSASGYRDVDPFPPPTTLPGNRQYQPDIKAQLPSPDDTIIPVEVERNTYKATERADRSSKWLRAAEAGRGVIYLVTPNREALTAIVTEIAAVRKQRPEQEIQIKAFTVFDIRAQKERRVGDTIWSPE